MNGLSSSAPPLQLLEVTLLMGIGLCLARPVVTGLSCTLCRQKHICQQASHRFVAIFKVLHAGCSLSAQIFHILIKVHKGQQEKTIALLISSVLLCLFVCFLREQTS